MGSDGYSFAPYNFIPFTEDVKQSPAAYDSYESLPPHDCYVEGKLSGEISYRLTALQEMRIGGGETVNGIKTIFRDGQGRCVIPGSTMRGFVRSHVEMLSFSYPENIDDSYILYRSFADKCKKLRDQYREAMNGREESTAVAERGYVKNVRVGYLYCRKDASGNKRLYVLPVKEFGESGCTCFKVHEATLVKAGALRKEHQMYSFDSQKGGQKQYDRLWANRLYKPYRMNESIRFNYENRKITQIGVASAPYEARLLNSGYIDKKSHHYLVSAEILPEARAIEIAPELFVAYKQDLERNTIRNDRFKKDSETRKFYELPNSYDESFSITDAEYAKRHGKLFFYRIENGRVTGFGPTPYFRIAFRHSIGEGIPYSKPGGYDYARAMFGFIDDQKSYKSRLSFQNAIGEDCDVCDAMLMSAAQPKASAIQLYLQQNSNDERILSTYNDTKFTLRGQKFYWKRSKPLPYSVPDKPNLNSRMQFVQPNSGFNGKIVFHNLSGEELGLLLLSLQYKDPVKVKRPERFLMGGGKAYGYGLVELSDVRLSLYDLKQSFACINAVNEDIGDNETRIAEYKNQFRTCMEKVLQENGISSYDNTLTVQTYKQYALMSENETDEYLAGYETGYMPLSDRTETKISYKSRKPLRNAIEIMNETRKKAITDISDSGAKVLWRGNRGIDKRAEQAIRAKFGKDCSVETMSSPISLLNVGKYKDWIIVCEERSLRRDEESTIRNNGLKLYLIDAKGKLTEKQ